MELVKSQLKGNSEIVKNFLRIDGLKNIQDLYLLSHNRLTLIRADGTVMFDSASDTEESHKYRAEIKEAFEKSEGFQVRYSTTVLDKQIYYSTLYDDDLVIRASASYSKIENKVKNTIKNRIMSFFILNVFLFLAYKNILRKYYFDKLNHMRMVVESGKEAKEMYLEEDKDLIEFWHVIKDWQNKNLENIDSLKEEKEKLQNLISSIDIGILLLDSKGEIISHNREAKYSFFTENIENKYNVKLKYSEFIEFINKLMSKNHTLIQEIYLLENKKHYIVRGKYIHESEKYIITIKDITQSKELANIEKKFISNISHELKTPLTNIKGYLIAIDGEDDREMQKSFIDIVHKNIDKMENIIGDFLNLQKLESSKIISKYPCDFKVLIDEVLDEMASIIGEKNPKIDIDLKLKSKDNYISVDKDKIKILLKNLIENALIYNNKEFVNLQIKVEESNEHLRISIKDNGIGIPEQELKNIFNRFYRVDKARTSNLGGTGLGLSLVNEIVELYSGAINVISKENEGSEFIVKILK